MTRFLPLACFASLIFLAPPAGQAAPLEVKPYRIAPGATYTYKPSPEGPGIAGGMPSAFELDFGVAGTFAVEYDRMAFTARLLNLDLVLTGNEAVQMNPPAFTPVTADRVEEFLVARLFDNLFVAAPLDQYQERTYDNFYLYDFLQGAIRLQGGFDVTPVDGPAMLFDASAQLIPEPVAAALLGVALALAAVGAPAHLRQPARK